MTQQMTCIGMTKHPSGQWLVTFKPAVSSMTSGENKILYILYRENLEVGDVFEGYVVCDMFIPLRLVKSLL